MSQQGGVGDSIKRIEASFGALHSEERERLTLEAKRLSDLLTTERQRFKDGRAVVDGKLAASDERHRVVEGERNDAKQKEADAREKVAALRGEVGTLGERCDGLAKEVKALKGAVKSGGAAAAATLATAGGSATTTTTGGGGSDSVQFNQLELELSSTKQALEQAESHVTNYQAIARKAGAELKACKTAQEKAEAEVGGLTAKLKEGDKTLAEKVVVIEGLRKDLAKERSLLSSKTSELQSLKVERWIGAFWSSGLHLISKGHHHHQEEEEAGVGGDRTTALRGRRPLRHLIVPHGSPRQLPSRSRMYCTML